MDRRTLSLAVIFVVVATLASGTSIPPYAQPNLAPFDAWSNSNLCLLNTTDSCPPNYLNQTGNFNLPTNESISQFCTPDCLSHFNFTLWCVNATTKYGQVITFIFNNKQTVYKVQSTGFNGCDPTSATYGTFNSTA